MLSVCVEAGLRQGPSAPRPGGQASVGMTALEGASGDEERFLTPQADRFAEANRQKKIGLLRSE